jgi:hypothetical protein
MTMIIEEGATRKIAVGVDEPTARYAAVTVAKGSAVAAMAVPLERQRVLVETLHNVGGMIQRAARLDAQDPVPRLRAALRDW